MPIIPDATVLEFVLGQAPGRSGWRALIDTGTGRELTYAELATAVRAAGAWLAARGVRPGDVLALCAPNSVEFVVTWYAASSIGAILTAVNPISSGRRSSSSCGTGTRWLVTTGELYAAKLATAAQESGVPRRS